VLNVSIFGVGPPDKGDIHEDICGWPSGHIIDRSQFGVCPAIFFLYVVVIVCRQVVLLLVQPFILIVCLSIGPYSCTSLLARMYIYDKRISCCVGVGTSRIFV
jgi:hypothetical protein